jgi:hypothetical protein
VQPRFGAQQQSIAHRAGVARAISSRSFKWSKSFSPAADDERLAVVRPGREGEISAVSDARTITERTALRVVGAENSGFGE